MIALVATAAGTFAVDLDSEEVDAAEPFVPPLRSRGSTCRGWSRPRRRARRSSPSSTPGRRCSSRTTAAPRGASPDAAFRRGARWRSRRPTPTRSSTPRATGSTSRVTAASSGRRSRSSCPRSRPSIWSKAQGIWNSPRATTTADAADEDALDPLGRAVDARVERRGPADLDALVDLDLLAEPDPAVARQVDGERPRRRAGRRILVDAVRRARTRASSSRPAVAGEAVDAGRRQHARAPAKSGASAGTSSGEPSST